MSDDPIEKPFLVEIAKQGRAVCKKCKQKCLQGELRIAKLVANPFGDGKMKNWYHVPCIFEVFSKQRPTTKRIDDPGDDIAGWDSLDDENRNDISRRVEECNNHFGVKPSPKKPPQEAKPSTSSTDPIPHFDPSHKDNQFREFRRVVADISNVSSYLEKTSIVGKMLTKGSDGTGFKGDIVLWCRLLLPGVVKRIYNLQSKQLVKLFSKIFQCDQDAMLEHLDQGDVSETIQVFYERSKAFKPAKKSTLSLQQVDLFLDELTNLTKEEEQMTHLKSFASKCTPNDLKIVVRLIKHDLRMNAGAKHVLDGVHPDAYQAFQSSRDIKTVIGRCLKDKGAKARIVLMTPVLPMLAEACKSVEQAMKKCPNGMYSEIKYDGERVQVHKQGSDFKYFSRSLKPVLAHKVAHFKNYIPQAFPHGRDLILDSEILMIDTQTGRPLPFGTLGVHKKSEFKDASVCLFVFDCIYYNGEILTDKPISLRKKILKENMTEIPNHIVFSEMEEIHDPKDLTQMIAKVLKLGLEGLVLKDLTSVYEPGKRHWLKVKKDYLFGGAMADSADLIVLGAWYGTGKKGGIMSIFLMGCYDAPNDRFCTVSKVSTGHDDKTLERLQSELDMVKITKVPDWLHCTKTMVPDFVARDPKKQPIWEITGAEFTQHEVHTAGISIRFPRVTKIRDDKSWESATSLQELKILYTKSKENTDISLLLNREEDPQPSNSNKKHTESHKKRGLEDPQPSNSKKIKTEHKTVKIRNPLPDYFHDIKALLDEEVREKQWDLIRHFVAYGGQICKNGENATHMVHLNNMVPKILKCGSDVKHVTTEWIKNCIIKESICDYRPFIVHWKPTQ
ncbi:DNA ligase 3 [Tribolium madens]|uniref:DNA ligase 3 n=1 Tax=Tribolium madens TaxID=41895 RepID=UPI001CF7383D|nr:DNA ligase 3 [Tribolium madens]